MGLNYAEETPWVCGLRVTLLFAPGLGEVPQVPVLGRVPVGLLGLCFPEDTGPRQSLLGVVAAVLPPD